MKIIGPNETGNAGFTPKVKKEGLTGGQDFGKILDDASKKMSSAQSDKLSGTQKTTGAHFPRHMALASVDPEGTLGGLSQQNKVVAQSEQILSRLEFFKTALENPKIDIAKFFPLVESLKSDGKSLEEISSKLTSNPELKNLAEETSTLAATEVIKFYRGDYG